MSIRRFMLAAFSFQLALGMLFLGTAPVSAAGGEEKKDDGHGGGDEDDPNALPEFDGPPPPLPWEIPRASENACSTEEIVVLGHGTLTLEDLDQHTGLVVSVGGEGLRLLGGDGGVSVEPFSLYNNQIGDAGATSLADAIKLNGALTELK